MEQVLVQVLACTDGDTSTFIGSITEMRISAEPVPYWYQYGTGTRGTCTVFSAGPGTSADTGMGTHEATSTGTFEGTHPYYPLYQHGTGTGQVLVRILSPVQKGYWLRHQYGKGTVVQVSMVTCTVPKRGTGTGTSMLEVQ